MRNYLPLLLGLLLALPASLFAQNCTSSRYLQPQFGVDTTRDVIYGTAPAMPAVYVAENVTVPYDLKLDIYQPAGDTLSKRPCLIMGFGGAFLIGDKWDEDMRSTCDSFARKGYVCISMNYRLNMNIADPNSGERAAYRAMQDWSAAIRWTKEKADSLRIDTNSIFIGGASAGGISAMGAAYMDDADRPGSTFANTFPARPDLGCFDCSGNTFNHSRRVKGVINLWGAVNDTTVFTAGSPADSTPLICFHGDLDPIVPYFSGFPFVGIITMPQLFGSGAIEPRRASLGLPTDLVLFPQEGHNIWGTVVLNQFTPGPSQHWNPIQADMRDFMFDLLRPATFAISGAQSSWVNDIRSYSVPARPGSKWCWEADGGTILADLGDTVVVRWDSTGLRDLSLSELNCLDVAGDPVIFPVFVGAVGREEGIASDGLKIWPSPFSGYVQVEGERPLPSQFLFRDVQGRELKRVEIQPGSTSALLQTDENWGSGIYFLEWKSEGILKSRRLYKE